MTDSSQMAEHDERLDLLDGLIYADTFDCAVTLDELWRYSRTAIDRDALSRRLHDDPLLDRIVVERQGLYCLDDRPALIDERPARIQRARVLQRRAQRVARVLRHVPFVRGLALTGSLAADDATEDADLDLVVVVAPARLGLLFMLLASAARLLGRRALCPNYYLREGALEFEPGSAYVAHELAQIRPLLPGGAGLLDANPWVTEVFPNARHPVALYGDQSERSRLQRLVEAPLAGALGDRLERAVGRVVHARLRIHYRERGEDVPDDVRASFDAGFALRFHGGRVDRTTLTRYAERRRQVAQRLEAERQRGA